MTSVVSPVSTAHRLSVAPMMDWTDRHCRYFHRLMTRRAMLYTEMVTAPAVIHGPKARLLDYDAARASGRLATGRIRPCRTWRRRSDRARTGAMTRST